MTCSWCRTENLGELSFREQRGAWRDAGGTAPAATKGRAGASLSRARACVLVILSLVAGMSRVQAATFNSSGTITVGSALQASPYPSSPVGSCSNAACITVSGLAGSITDVKLTFNNFNATNAFDLGILLQAPSGAALDVMSNACHVAGPSTFRLTDSGTVNGHAGSGSNCFNTGDWLATTHHFPGFVPDDFPSPGPGTTGYTRAEPDSAATGSGSTDTSNGNGTFAHVFNGLTGTDANGVWRLYVTNQVGGGGTSGNISSWTLEIATTGGGTPTTTTLSAPAPNPSFTSGANSVVTLTATVTTSSGVATDGSVTFHDNTTGTDIASAPVDGSGVASTMFTFTTEGAHVLVATYTGGTAFAASPVSNAVTQQVIKTTTPQAGAPVGTVGFCNTGGIMLPTSGAALGPGNPYPSDVVVSGVSGLIQEIKVYINGYTSTNPSANALMLVGPNGETLEFMASTGGSTTVSNLNLIWDDLAASQALPSTVSLTSGSYRPTSAVVSSAGTYCQTAVCNGVTVSEPAPALFEVAGPAGDPARTLLEQFAGATPNGVWKLFAMQRSNPDTASINNWCLNFTLANTTMTTTSIAASPSPATTGDAVTLIATVTNSASPGTPIGEGSVTFNDSVTGNTLGTSAVANGHAMLTNITTLSEGDHTITALYTGTANFGASSGSVNLRLNNPIIATTPGGAYKYCNQASAIGIPKTNHLSGPAYPYPSNVGVTHLPGSIKTVEVDLNGYNNMNPQGLQSLLVGPCQTASCTPTAADALDFFSNPQSTVSTGTINLAFLDAAANTIPNTSTLDVITGGAYRPFSRVNTNTYPMPAPAGPYQYAAPAGSSTPPAFTLNGAGTGVFQDRIGNGPWSLYLNQNISAANDASVASWCLSFTINPPVLAITKSHSGNFRQGDTGRTYTIHVTNEGPGPTGGTTTVVDDVTSAPGLTITDLSGTGWTCTVATRTCTSTMDIDAGNSFPDITVTVDVAGNAATGTNSQTNSASASGGGSLGSVTANDPTTVMLMPNTATETPSNTPLPTSTPPHTPTHTATKPPTATPTATPTVPAVSVSLSIGVGRPGGIACVGATLSNAGAPVAHITDDVGFDSSRFAIGSCVINPVIGPGTGPDKRLTQTAVGTGITRLEIDSSPNLIPNGVLYACPFTIAVGTPNGVNPLSNAPAASDPTGTSIPGVTGTAGQNIVTSCTGDCNGDGRVTIGEVIRCVNMFLGQPFCDPTNPSLGCPVADASLDGSVSIGEVTQCVTRFLNGC